MLNPEMSYGARTVPTQFVETGGRRLAYRSIGHGMPLVLCLRFRGIMDSWDPAFLDRLAENFRVITFDYSGFGQSTGDATYKRESLAQDAIDLIDALGLYRLVIAGWSIGGAAAQIVAVRRSKQISHVIPIGSTPPGPQPYPSEDIFLETALKPFNSLEDEHILFFEPKSERSRAASEASHKRIASRTADRSRPITPDVFMPALQAGYDADAIFPDPEGRYAEQLVASRLPVLAICGDHDIVFPVENWHALNRKWPSLHVLTIPSAGHGPQHQEPELCADMIASFVANVA